MNLSPEWKILLASARTNVNSDDLQRIRQELFNTDLDWHRLTEISYQHGIAPLICHNLRRMGVSAVLPQGAMELLERSYYINAMRNALLYKELNGVLRALKDIGCEIIALKGAALAETVYPNRALRPMSDIDLLVRKESLSRVESKLLEMGYVLDVRGGAREWYKEHHHHLVFVKDVGSPIETHLEIHWNIECPSRPFKIDIDGMWERALAVKIADVQTLVLSPEDLILHLCEHACKHNLTGGIRPLCDISEAIRYYSQKIDWRQIEIRSTQWRIDKYVYLMLRLTKELLGAAVPDSVLEALEPDDFDARLFGWAREKILGDNGTSPVPPDLYQLCWEGSGFKDRVNVLMKILSPELIAKYYGLSPASKEIYFYYPARLKDLFVRHGLAIWRLLCHDRELTALAERESQLAQWLDS